MKTIKLMAAAVGLMALAACQQHHDSSGDLWRVAQQQYRGR